jgi:hypothetical protein
VLNGPVLDFVRRRLLARAEAIGWTRSFEADLQLLVDGEIRPPLCAGDAALFLFPAGARDVRLKSNTFVPALVGGADPRSLGFSLVGLVLSSGRGDARSVFLDDERLRDGLHPEEAQNGVAWRWTKGELVLSPDFWAGLSGPIALTVTHNNTVARQWVRPPKAESEAQVIATDVSAREISNSANVKSILKDPAGSTHGLIKRLDKGTLVPSALPLYGTIFCMKPNTEDELI